MKLLIVEDEQITRENLAMMLDYGKLGFEEILTADNGKSGLAKAFACKPEVILTDIRMPRMDGITFAGLVKEKLPGTRIIFLSAYAELDYYRAAIRLQTVSYIEKPVDASQLEAVLKEAANQLHRETLAQQQEQADLLEKRRELAYRMTMPNWKMQYQAEAKEILPEKYSFCTTIVIQAETKKAPEEILRLLEAEGKSSLGEILCTRNKEECFIVQVLRNEERTVKIAEYVEKLKKEFTETDKCYFSVGSTVTPGRSSQSYQAAVVGLQRCFYEEYGYVSWPCEEKEALTITDAYRAERRIILDMIENGRLEEAGQREGQLFERLIQEKKVLGTRIQDIYIDFVHSLIKEGEKQSIAVEILEDFRRFIWNEKGNYRNCRELHQMFQKLIEEIWQWEKEKQGDSSQIALIKSFIEKNYQNTQFSLVEISEYVHMSVSYMCVQFKKETGKTINQYLTEVRMHKAKKYLTDISYSIAEISVMCGYQDISYFGRIFKKTWHVTPLEYRESRRTGL